MAELLTNIAIGIVASFLLIITIIFIFLIAIEAKQFADKSDKNFMIVLLICIIIFGTVIGIALTVNG